VGRNARAMLQPCPVYRRSDALENRRKLMEAWAAYCERIDVASNIDDHAAAPVGANGVDTTRRYWAPG
jgi:hypothetical protein